MKEFASKGARFRCIAFPFEGGNRWSIVTDKGFFNRNIPDECHEKMLEFTAAGHKILCVAFPPPGGNRWSVITDKSFFNRNIPDECHDKMVEFTAAGQKILWVAFPPAGGNRWSIITNKSFFNRNIPDECHDKMVEFTAAGQKVLSVAFPRAGGNRWTILTNKSFFNRNISGACHRVMRSMTNCGVGMLRVVAYHPSNAFAVLSDAAPQGRRHVPLVVDGQRFSIDVFAASLRAQLDGKVVKYGFMVRYGSAIRAWAAGPKRTAANPPAQEFTVYDWFNPASVTKTITAVALLQLIEKNGLTINEPIHLHLPTSWDIPASVKTVTVKELLNHTSGFRSGVVTYDALQELVENGINLADKVPKYENTNYGLARIVAAYLNGHLEDDSDQSKATCQNFINYVQKQIFDPLGIPNVQWKPDADDPTEFYPDPPGESGGTSYSDWTLKPGSAGVHLSIAELSMFVDKLSDTNDLLSAAMRAQMDAEELGWGAHGAGKGLYYSKGGAFPASMNSGAALRSVIIKYANGVQAVVVVNGDINFGDDDVANAYNAAWQPL
ncbi:MAG: beta-lactamase family protein [Anaerolineae bacterium]|nr:beta-lactamase family protein [Anaerolineae bacterium]